MFMKIRTLKIFLLITLIEGLLAATWILLEKFLTGRGHLLPFVLGVLCLLVVVVIGIFIARLDLNPVPAEKWLIRAGAWLRYGERLFVVKDILVVGLIFSIEGFLLTFLSFPLSSRPVTVWVALIFAQAWIVLLHSCRDLFRIRPSGLRYLRQRWNGLEPVQRRTALILFAIAVVYFGFFAWVNWNGNTADPKDFYAAGGDEVVIYPVAVAMVTPDDTFAANVYHFVIHEEYHYGYPYFYLNGLILFGSRLAFGPDFANHTQVNLFLLRQLVSVLPMILAILIFVYIATRFKSWWFSTAMFVVMLLIPGVVRYNQRFWHPDALMVLFVAVTFYYLNRDRQRFGRDFYYAAVMCALAAAVKLYGFFFFLTIAVYLCAGLIRKILTLKKTILAGFAFVLVMGVTLLMSSPFLLVPSARQTMTSILSGKTAEMETGYTDSGMEDIYHTGIDAWMPFFALHYTQPYFFYFLFGVLLLGSFLGPVKDLNRLLLAWCVVVAGYLILFVAVKSYHYQLPLFLPLYAGGFLFPSILNESARTVRPFLQKPSMHWIVWGLTAAMIGSQFLFNLWAIFSSVYVRVYF
jgi:hypothetical protein